MTSNEPTTAWETDRLAELAQQRHDLFQQLYALGQRQLELIDQGDITQLIQVLSVKHHLLAEVQQVEKRLDPYRTQDPNSRPWRSTPLREHCAELVVRSETLLHDILAQEKLSEDRMRQHRDATAARLQMAHSATHARTAYADAPPHVRLLNLSSEK